MRQRKLTGFRELDKLTGGLVDGSLVVIGSRPGMGKTTLALDIARKLAANQETRTVIFSYEMSAQLIALRVCPYGEILYEKAMGLSGVDLPIHVYGNPRATVAEMRQICKNTENLGAVVIDYFQLISNAAFPSQPNRSENTIAHSLKGMAQELNVPVICTSQLSRDCENRADHQPILEDMPSTLRQEADQILLLYRERYYDPEASEAVKCIVAKNRYGDIGTVKLRWDPKRVRFADI